MRAGLRALLQKHDHVEITGEAATGLQAIELVRSLQPDIVIMDVGMPEMNGIEATRKILKLMPDCRILALSMHSDRRFVMEMLDAGAGGYLLKDCAVEELEFAINALLKNQVYLSPSVANYFIKRSGSMLRSDGVYDSILSPREREVLQLISDGRSTAEIAATLHLSIKTIETHRKHIMDKLDLRSVAELTKYAIRSGLTNL